MKFICRGLMKIPGLCIFIISITTAAATTSTYYNYFYHYHYYYYFCYYHYYYCDGDHPLPLPIPASLLSLSLLSFQNCLMFTSIDRNMSSVTLVFEEIEVCKTFKWILPSVPDNSPDISLSSPSISFHSLHSLNLCGNEWLKWLNSLQSWRWGLEGQIFIRCKLIMEYDKIAMSRRDGIH